MFGRIAEPWWDNGTVALVGGGPSLIGFDFSRLCRPGWTVVGINHSIFDSPCHAGISVDRPFIEQRRGRLEEAAKCMEVYLAWGRHTPISFDLPGAINLHRLPKWGLSDDLGAVHTLSTSGFAALNLAILKRAKRIILFGYDYGIKNGKHHYHNGHGPLYNARIDQHWAVWANRYDRAVDQINALGVSVINASSASAVKAFPRVSIDEAMECKELV